MTLLNDALRAELTRMYRAPDRFYHGLSHVDALLGLLATHRAAAADADAVEAAIWFHDAVYDARAAGPANEVASAALAVARLSELPHVSSDRVAKIAAMIEATASHVVPAALEGDDGARADAALFLDMDLSILGAEAQVFDAYEAAVRKEYAWVHDEAWRKGRADVLRRFLGRERIFHSELFRALYEDAARGNLQRSLARL
ncbi:hypothetical protein B0T26DRAFT_646167 [Lasiosphaeria miniovina]|uniref:Metal-dependent HD superfamily phosphohydrolase n=1 Tax=Lasiosphaeria miniovina TaxID=1954250 RepID=A0AA40AL76_9PEZI|nr:uncharacterized protein B0T26DRAFT_646167 [Lasiosphaeria miniovina]KAK0717810.1 hypothetical protein B0T26DRAFT_646167 [Lasiosphaeria miniovina]